MLLCVVLLLSIYHALCRIPLVTDGQKLNLQKAVNHHITGLNNNTRKFTYVVFTDPQLGLYDVVIGNSGTQWQYDINKLKKFGAAIKTLSPTPDFIICLGDLNNAYPESEPREQPPGFLSPYRPPQTYDLMQTLQDYFDNDIPLFMLAGNHDLTENAKFRHIDSFERVWGNGYFYFWNGGRVFVTIETQLFRSEEEGTVVLRDKQVKWLKNIFAKLPRDAPKTVFQHVALFIDNASEADSDRAGKALPSSHRNFLLDLFCSNNIKIVFSGHTHFNSFPKPYKCPQQNREVRQIVLTALSAQLKWKSDTKFYPVGKPSYMIAKVDSLGNTTTRVVELDAEKARV